MNSKTLLKFNFFTYVFEAFCVGFKNKFLKTPMLKYTYLNTTNDVMPLQNNINFDILNILALFLKFVEFLSVLLLLQYALFFI